MGRYSFRKTDTVQPLIMAALREAGATVQDLSMVGKGCPDLLVGYHGKNFLIECKTKGKNEKRMTDLQQIWHGMWQGQVAVVRSPKEARDVIRD